MEQIVFNQAVRAKAGANHRDKRLVSIGQRHLLRDRFSEKLGESGKTLQKTPIQVLQVNLGKMCNLTCEHCHVEAGPNRTEMIEAPIVDRLLEIVSALNIKVVDLTGGAPEMASDFRRFVSSARELGAEVIVRSNLTILVEEGYESCVDFFAENSVHVIASLPCYSESNVDKQRGDGVFAGSIEALRRLNEVGYGREGSGLVIDLVYNPGGPSLPPAQAGLEKAYKEKLLGDFGIVFNSLFAITNLPIGRFYSDLKKEGMADCYDKLLQENFNADTVDHLMCKNTLNVSYDGWVYDCDFNQMLEIPMIVGGKPLHVTDEAVLESVAGCSIQTGDHCFGCTAGAGSSCQGELL